MDFDRFEALTFDCYGTIIDWESGILSALRGLIGGSEAPLPSDDELLQLFGRFEPEAESGDFRPYRQVLTRVAEAFGRELRVAVAPEAVDAFADSVRRWPAFADSSDALSSLSERYRLAIVSNIDDDLFEGSAAQLAVEFDQVVTAQQVRSYKPATAHFEEALERLALPVDRVLHVAQSLYHDIAPAKSLGFSCVWVNRRTGKTGPGATPPAAAAPDLEVPDLATLAELVKASFPSQ